MGLTGEGCRLEQGQHDWGPVAGAVGIFVGAASAVIMGAWKFLSGKGGASTSRYGDLEKRMAELAMKVNTLEEQQRETKGREAHAETEHAEIFRELRVQGKQLAAIAGALGLPAGNYE